MDGVAVAAERRQRLALALRPGAAGDVPQARGAVEAAGREGQAVRAEGERIDRVGLLGQFAHQCAARSVPQAYAAVLARARQPTPVGAEGHREDRVRVAVEHVLGPSAQQVPDAHR
nr:hypothetical protein [Azoarcus sp. DN11]